VDKRSALLEEIDRTRARVVGAAQIALWYFEAQNFDATEKALRDALNTYNAALHAYRDALNSSPAEKESTTHGNRTAA
jgi:hypothetical protein